MTISQLKKLTDRLRDNFPHETPNFDEWCKNFPEKANAPVTYRRASQMHDAGYRRAIDEMEDAIEQLLKRHVPSNDRSQADTEAQ